MSTKMQIVHICLAAAYVEGYGYQENILPQYHAEMGHNVTVLTNDRVFNSKYELGKREKKDYVNEYGVRVLVLEKSNRYGYYSKFGDYCGVYEYLTNLNPDIVFVHGGQFVALKDVIEYCKKNHNVRLYIDQHGDYYNMRLDRWQDRFVQHWVYGHWMRKAIPYTKKYWGVTPWRCEYLNDVYRIPKEKIGLLVMGGDDRCIHFDQMPDLRSRIRKELDLDDEDFVLITGGKIDETKNIHILMKAVSEINRDKLKLIVFGQPTSDMETQIEALSQDKHIRNIGWLDSTAVYDYFLASDLAVFPGTHSVLWEQACACGIPGVFKDWEGMHHVDVGGNARFIVGYDLEEIKKTIERLIDSNKDYGEMANVAAEKAIKEFSYSSIAKRAIEE